MSAHFFQGSLDDEIQRELNKYLTPLRDYVHRNKNVRITALRVSEVDYDSITHLLNLFDRESKRRGFPVPKVYPGATDVGFYYGNRWVKIIPTNRSLRV